MLTTVIEEGLRLYHVGAPDAAAEQYRQAIRTVSSASQSAQRSGRMRVVTAGLYNDLASCLSAMWRVAEAEEAFRLALSIAPPQTSSRLHNNLSSLYRDTQR